MVFQIRDAVNHIAEVLRNNNPANNAPAYGGLELMGGRINNNIKKSAK